MDKIVIISDLRNIFYFKPVWYLYSYWNTTLYSGHSSFYSTSIGSSSGRVLLPRPQLHWFSWALHKCRLCPGLQLPRQLGALLLSRGHLVHLTQQVVCDLLAHHRVTLVVGVLGDELAHPGGGSQQVSWGRSRMREGLRGWQNARRSKVWSKSVRAWESVAVRGNHNILAYCKSEYVGVCKRSLHAYRHAHPCLTCIWSMSYLYIPYWYKIRFNRPEYILYLTYWYRIRSHTSLTIYHLH